VGTGTITTTITTTTTTTITTTEAMAELRLLILPGLGGSGPEHWQTRWEACVPGCTRVEQSEWDAPRLEVWLKTVDEAIAREGGPVVLVAHSLACSLVAHGARRPAWAKVAGALLVAPADVESPSHTPPETRNFAPIPRAKLPFPAVVVASSDDPYGPLERARHFAEAWGADLVEVGAKGHINAASGLGEWPEGRRILGSLLGRVTA
jgi:predicted alpha/beta hydrolase family esterase